MDTNVGQCVPPAPTGVLLADWAGGTLCPTLALALSLLILVGTSPISFAQDMALLDVLIDGEGWRLVAEGYQFTDAACADAAGNFYFTDVAKGTTVNRISPDVKVSAAIENAPKISGLKFGPDGRLYACTPAPVDNAQPNDLVVSRKEIVYFTETGKGQVTIVDASGNTRGATGIKAPNGITLSPDQGALAVSEYSGTNVWAFRIEGDVLKNGWRHDHVEIR